MTKPLPDYVRGALAQARLAIEQARAKRDPKPPAVSGATGSTK